MLAAAEWWEVVGALGAAAGAIAAAVGAVAAWRAASASRATSRDALEALAVGIRPRVSVGVQQLPRQPGCPMPGPTRLVVRVVAVGEWPARDLDLEATFGDGERFRDRREHLDAGGDPMNTREPQLAGPAPRRRRGNGRPRQATVIDWPEHLAVTLRYSDSRDVARYEYGYACDLKGGGVNLAVGAASAVPTERRLR